MGHKGVVHTATYTHVHGDASHITIAYDDLISIKDDSPDAAEGNLHFASDRLLIDPRHTEATVGEYPYQHAPLMPEASFLGMDVALSFRSHWLEPSSLIPPFLAHTVGTLGWRNIWIVDHRLRRHPNHMSGRGPLRARLYADKRVFTEVLKEDLAGQDLAGGGPGDDPLWIVSGGIPRDPNKYWSYTVHDLFRMLLAEQGDSLICGQCGDILNKLPLLACEDYGCCGI